MQNWQWALRIAQGILDKQTPWKQACWALLTRGRSVALLAVKVLTHETHFRLPWQESFFVESVVARDLLQHSVDP